MPSLRARGRHITLAIFFIVLGPELGKSSNIDQAQHNINAYKKTYLFLKKSQFDLFSFDINQNSSNSSLAGLNLTYPTLDRFMMTENYYRICLQNNASISRVPVEWCDFLINLLTKHRSRHKRQAVIRNRGHLKAKGFCRKPWQFLCKNGRCISQDHYCDGKNSCGDNSDELNCTWCNKTIQVTKMWQTLKSPDNKEFKKGQSIYCYYLLQIPLAIHKAKNSTTPSIKISTKRHRHKEHHSNNSFLGHENTDEKPVKTSKTEARRHVITLLFNVFNFGLFDESENCFAGYLRIIDGPTFAQSALRNRVSSKSESYNISIPDMGQGQTETSDLSNAFPDLNNSCNCDLDPIMSHEIDGIGSYLCGQMSYHKRNPMTGPNDAHTFYSQYNWVRLHLNIRDFDPKISYFALKFRAIDMSTKSGYHIPKDLKNNHTYINATNTDTNNKILNSEISQGTLIQMSGNDQSVYVTKDTYCNRTYVNCNWPNCKIQSPGYPGFFLPSITCGYRLLNTKPGNIQVKVTQYGDTFNVGSRMCEDPLLCNTISGIRTTKKTCPLAWISFYDDDRPSEEKLIGTFCGDGKVPTIKSSGNALYIEFKNVADASALIMRRFYFISTWSEMRSEVPSFGSSFTPGTTNCDFILTSYTLKDLADTTRLENDDNVKRKRDQINDDHIWDDNESHTSNQSRGKIVNLRHWFPANTTCRITLRGRPWERVWLYFKQFSYIPNEDPNLLTHSNDTEYIHDPCSDMISLIDSEVENEATKLMARFCGHWGPKICRPAVGGREKGRGRRLKRFLSCPSDSAIYISTGSSFLVIFHGSRGSYSQPDIRYDLRYEFVDTWKHGMSVRGTLCDEDFSSDKRKKGLITSPRNLAFLYYKGRMAGTPDRVTQGSRDNQTSLSTAVKRDSKAGDMKDGGLFAINCKYTLRASKYGNEKLLINLFSLRIHTSSHDNRRCDGCCSNHDGTCQNGLIKRGIQDDKNSLDHLKNINYLSIKEIPDSNKKDPSNDVIMSEYDKTPCFCNSRYSSIFGKVRDHHLNNFTYITKSSTTVVIEFNIAHLRWKRGNIYPEKQAFELTYEYINFDCGEKRIFNNYEGDIIFPPLPITDKLPSQTPIKGVHCRWKVTVGELFWVFFVLKNLTLGKTCGSSYLRFWVPYTNMTTKSLKSDPGGYNGTRILKTLCQNESDYEATFDNNMFYLFSHGFNTHTYYKDQSNVAIVDLLSTHPQTFIHLTFSQISLIKAILPYQQTLSGRAKSWQTSPSCKYHCPDNATCITERQMCTGVPSCPSPVWMKMAQGPGGATGFYKHVPLTYENPKFCALRNRFRNSWHKILPITASILIVIIGVIIVVIFVAKKKKVRQQKNSEK